MAKIESAGNSYIKEPKPVSPNTGIWIEGGVVVWESRSGFGKKPEQLDLKIKSLLLGAPGNTDIQGSRVFRKAKDIVEVIFGGRGGKPDEIFILQPEVCKRSSNGKVIEQKASSIHDQITSLIAEKAEQPKQLYWEHHEINGFKGDSDIDMEHIEVTVPYSEIEIEMKKIDNNMKTAGKRLKKVK